MNAVLLHCSTIAVLHWCDVHNPAQAAVRSNLWLNCTSLFFVLLRKWETNGRRVYWLCLRHRSKWIQPEAVGRLDTKSCWLFCLLICCTVVPRYSVVCISFLDEMQFDGKSWSPFVLARLERPAWFSEEMFFFFFAFLHFICSSN